MGIQGTAVEEPGALSEMVAAFVCGEIQDAHPGPARAIGFPAVRWRRVPAFYHPAAAQCPVENAALPGRRTLGYEAAKLPALGQDGERLGRSVDRSEVKNRKPQTPGPNLQRSSKTQTAA